MKLECRGLVVSYGGLRAVDEVDFVADTSECVTIVGANGAGKSTLVNALAGLVPVESGTVTWDGEPVTNLRPHQLVQRGIGLVPEGRRLFAEMSVEDNIRVAASVGERRKTEWDEDRIYDLFPRLAERRRIRAARLSGGEQQMLAIARTMRLGPSLIVLDEPSIGLAPLAVRVVVDALAVLREAGVGIVIVEQNVAEVRRIADRAYLLSRGQILKEGPAQDVLVSDILHAAYLGGRAQTDEHTETSGRVEHEQQ